ncbi:hypothetical protein A2W24_03460 [Microgenomates group bacterium RBG_16_45_19]|nr:MAG: hypothetical protein A2W24_03460 [Microgenomates group bacterium RBG_16_45_19]
MPPVQKGLDQSQLYQSALRYLAVRPRSTQEMVDYLNNKTGQNQPLTQGVIDQLLQFNLLNDAKFAIDWVNYRFRQDKGPILIRQELKRKGISLDLIDSPLLAIAPTAWQSQARHLLTKRHYPLPLNLANKAKIYRYLASRGYPSTIIIPVIDGYTPS